MSKGQVLISEATQRNWKKLNTTDCNRLKSRANKSKSDKFIVPNNYICIDGMEDLIQEIATCPYSNYDIFYSLCLQKLQQYIGNPNVERFVSEYGRRTYLEFHIPDTILNDPEKDWLGFLYQMRIPEGERNLLGQYYTNDRIIKEMLADMNLNTTTTFLDPCCGSGAFLMGIRAESLAQLYGTDIDDIAIMIAKANLIALYPNDKLYPQLFCKDYLEDNASCPIDVRKFDVICTNPPWGICKTHDYPSDVIRSKERSSLFFVKAFEHLKRNGIMSFLMPSSLLKVKSHKDFRTFIMTNTKIEKILMFNERFNGVYTDFFSITVINERPMITQSYQVIRDNQTEQVSTPAHSDDIELSGDNQKDILRLIEERGRYNLSDSIWALGIVTGDNKNKLTKDIVPGYEAIYTGKEIEKYYIKKASNYISYNRTQLQQCARDEYYRCPEKLVYKFISKTLCFAYDNSSSLFLNSANILIPNIQRMSIKTVMAFLNSELFSYYYSKKFSDIKVLKGNLMKLPFPEITRQQDEEISGIVDLILNGDKNAISLIDESIYSIYRFTPEIINKIRSELK